MEYTTSRLVATLPLWLAAAQIHSAEQPVRVLEGHLGVVHSVAFSPNGRLLVSGGGDRNLKFWELSEDAEDRARHEKLFAALDSDLFGKREDAYLELRNLGDVVAPRLRELAEKSPSAEVRYRCTELLQALIVPKRPGLQQLIRKVVFSPTGSGVASASRDGTVEIWDLKGQRDQRLKLHRNGVWSLAYSADGKHIASGGGDHEIQITEVKTGSVVRRLKGHSSTVQDLIYSPNGQQIISAGGFDRTVRVWDVADGSLRVTLNSEIEAVLAVAISPDAKLIAAAGYGDQVIFWNIARRIMAGEISTKTNTIRDIVFSPNGKLLATVGKDHHVKIWDVATKELLATLKGHRDVIYAVEFSPDGQYLATGGHDKTIRIWARAAWSAP